MPETTEAPGLTEPEHFFYVHAGYSYRAGEETADEARLRCARELASAETWAAQRRYTVTTEHDPDVMADDAGSVELVASGECVNLTALLVDGAGNVLDALGGIVVPNEDDPYVRVVGAELASSRRFEEDRAEAKRLAEVLDHTGHEAACRGCQTIARTLAKVPFDA